MSITVRELIWKLSSCSIYFGFFFVTLFLNVSISQLNGKPFWADSTDGIDSKLLICSLLAMLQKKG